uniref:Cytosol aminopeptidase domain-containing protein n=1 Tax=Timspurckia oligopyrenoides TaxID=708627 RepID=A0A7S0ZAW7_9RHOD|mmetsp:Transcript_10691/g.19302  ORF Transcript_10691/g.19302 Transcript_10691/m.19302 type:complete len:648 (+) Transcript_10691:49-1992(+)
MIGKFLKLPYTNGVQLVFSPHDCDHGAPLIVVIGQRTALLRYIQRPEWLPALSTVASLLSESDIVGPLPIFLVPGSPIRRVAICVVPSISSRHNAPGRPDVISDMVSRHCKHVPRGLSVEIHLVLSDAAHAYSSGLAIARAMPLYSRKSIHNRHNPQTNGNAQPNTQTDTPPARVIVSFDTTSADGESKDIDLDTIEAACDGSRLSAYLVDAPCSEMHTDMLTNECGVLVKALGGEANHVYMQTIRGEELQKLGLNLLYHVGRAAEHPSNLVILTYAPPGLAVNAQNGSIVFVGKGIVFDTGGTCLKSTESMRGMKRDMGGAASVLGAFQTIVRKRMNKHVVHAVLCLAENQISERATRIDDILVSFSGKTVEVNNTDAEGRLVVADAVAYAARMLNPSVIIDVATLTGSQAIATGRKIAAVYTNSEAMENLAISAGRHSGDLCHPLPYVPEFWRELLFSDVADMKNAVSRRDNCPSACAAQFIAEHLPPDFNEVWMHVDIAGPASAGERGTGFGVGLLVTLLERIQAGAEVKDRIPGSPKRAFHEIAHPNQERSVVSTARPHRSNSGNNINNLESNSRVIYGPNPLNTLAAASAVNHPPTKRQRGGSPVGNNTPPGPTLAAPSPLAAPSTNARYWETVTRGSAYKH